MEQQEISIGQNMIKSIIHFRFLGNITWQGDKNTWAQIIQEYLESELEIGNGSFLSASVHDEHSVDCPKTTNGYSPKEIDIEIIADLPRHILDDEFAIRRKLITMLEDEKVSLLKFQNCGNHQHITAVLN
jgi:hypothetical protein